MSFDLAAHLAAEEAHARSLAADPAWRAYVKDKAARMAKDQPSMYGHLPDLVAQTPINQPETPNGIPA
jgi:hypothetical protein